MLAHLCIALSFLAAPDFTLDNGIRISPQTSDNRSLVFMIGYQSGVRNESHSFSGLASIVSHYLQSTTAARSLALAAYGSGGEVAFVEELDRTAVRISVPLWAEPMILSQAAAFLSETPDKNPDLVNRAIQTVLASALPDSLFRARVDDEIRVGLLGSHAYSHPLKGWKTDLEQITNEDVIRFFDENYGTDRAFVVTTAALPEDVRRSLTGIAKRTSRKLPEATDRVMNAERTLHFASDEQTGAVIFASPVPGVFYHGWYATLLLDRVIQRTFREKPATALALTLDPYYWRIEVPVPAGQLADAFEANLLQDINRLQFSRTRPEDLEAARRDALDYLNSPYVREWFASEGIESRRQEGLQWIQSISADDLRSTARDTIALNHVVASWSAKPRQNTVKVENLSAVSAAAAEKTPINLPSLNGVPVPPFPSHVQPAKTYSTPQRLTSGVWLAPSNGFRIFLSAVEAAGLPDGVQRQGSNGAFWNFASEPDANVVRSFQKYRADRILVLVPSGSLDAARTLWSSFKSNDRDNGVVAPQGKVANIDLPALVVLKSMLDRKLIESGWWRDASLHIDATLGATLEIDGPSQIRAQVMEWIKNIAAAPLPDADFIWAREAAVQHLNDVLPDVQALLWQRVPDYMLEDLQTITPSHVQDVAKLYF